MTPTFDAPVVTPVRALGSVGPDGVRVLRDVGSTYRDGGEDAVLGIINAASDVHSDSDELVRAASGWAQRYHLDPARANVLRSVDLPADARVLEIGAGCGAVTRYLGEQCAIVDALEPVPARAAAARARTHDLPGVDVLLGELDDVPAEASYDVVVVIGVLEYVGGGSASRRPYLDFLQGIADRLVDGGTLVLAIENQLGVKYVAGSPEDHTNRVWDSLDGYSRGGQARTFSRRQLEQLMIDTGLAPKTRVAFPDYKMTRVVLGDFPDEARSLLYRVPQFPSQDWQGGRPRLGDEYSLWRELVAAGLESDFGNSFVVLAGKSGGDGGSSLWPDERLGVFFSVGRRRHLEVRTDIELSDGEVWFRRAPRSQRAAPTGDGMQVTSSRVRMQEGLDLVEVVAQGGPDAFGAYADRWLALLDQALADDPAAVSDVVPHNLVVAEDDSVTPIDIEFVNFPMSRDQVVRRGIYNLALRCAPMAHPQRWLPARTVADLMVAFGRHVGLPDDGSWIEQMYDEEVAFFRAVRALPSDPDGPDRWQKNLESALRKNVNRRLSTLPLGDRVWEQRAQAAEALTAERADSKRLRADLEKAKKAASAANTRAKQAEARLPLAPKLRIARTLRRAVARALPRGSARGHLARQALGRRNSR